MDLETATREELIRLIVEQGELTVKLRAVIAMLEERVAVPEEVVGTGERRTGGHDPEVGQAQSSQAGEETAKETGAWLCAQAEQTDPAGDARLRRML